MNSTLTTARGRHEHPPQPSFEHQPHRVRRVSLLDRLALHLGVALIKWGRRPVAVRERRVGRDENQLAQLERERIVERNMLLGLPRR
jgi:hypothetical protein